MPNPIICLIPLRVEVGVSHTNIYTAIHITYIFYACIYLLVCYTCISFWGLYAHMLSCSEIWALPRVWLTGQLFPFEGCLLQPCCSEISSTHALVQNWSLSYYFHSNFNYRFKLISFTKSTVYTELLLLTLFCLRYFFRESSPNSRAAIFNF